ncbi:MAG: NADH-quinone oxidoreductase subunit L [Armatimonadota bacterium]
MDHLLWIIVISPFMGALILALFGSLMPKKLAGTIGCASIAVSLAGIAVMASSFFRGDSSAVISSPAYQWISIGDLHVDMVLRLDALSVVMTLTIAFVALLIHLYSSQSMFDEENYNRFFAFMNLFVGFMFTLILAGNLLLLYLGWEGVGLCSYLLIGFYYKHKKNGYAARKAFIITRIGDTAMIIGIFLIYRYYGTLDIQMILKATPSLLADSSTVLTLIALLLLGGAIGKSAQLPLQTWLPDAMAGPTPVSALIHAATMVIAGVYLIARMNPIFIASPTAQYVTAVIGTITLLYAGITALVQRDIKRVLAYSTMSQIGYMFLALGLGAWGAAIFHFVTHAFFKSLLFLTAGVVIDALHHEQDMFKMGGLKKQLPVAYWTFLAGAASLSALPLITAGFYSKDAIVWASRASMLGGTWFWIAAIVGSLITVGYSFRVVFLVFHGEEHLHIEKSPGALMNFSLITLSILAIISGFANMPHILGGFNPFDRLTESVLPALRISEYWESPSREITYMTISGLTALFGVFLTYLYFRQRKWSEAIAESPVVSSLHRFFASGWGFDILYDRVIVQPFKMITELNRGDIIDSFYEGMGKVTQYAHIGLSKLQTGRMRDYAIGLLVGAILITVISLIR